MKFLKTFILEETLYDEEENLLSSVFYTKFNSAYSQWRFQLRSICGLN